MNGQELVNKLIEVKIKELELEQRKFIRVRDKAYEVQMTADDKAYEIELKLRALRGQKNER